RTDDAPRYGAIGVRPGRAYGGAGRVGVHAVAPSGVDDGSPTSLPGTPRRTVSPHRGRQPGASAPSSGTSRVTAGGKQALTTCPCSRARAAAVRAWISAT